MKHCRPLASPLEPAGLKRAGARTDHIHMEIKVRAVVQETHENFPAASQPLEPAELERAALALIKRQRIATIQGSRNRLLDEKDHVPRGTGRIADVIDIKK